MSKVAKSVSIIGGSDGPTSIFLVGNKQKEKNLITRLENTLRIKKHRRRLEKARRSIKPGAHTLDETIYYMKQQYSMTEADHTIPIHFMKQPCGVCVLHLCRENGLIYCLRSRN